MAILCVTVAGLLFQSCGDEGSPKPEEGNFADGMVLHYNFENGVEDLTGNGFNGKVYGLPVKQQGSRGEGLYFNEVDRNNGCDTLGGDYVLVPRIGDVWNEGLTVACWASFTEIRNFERLMDFGNGIGETYGDNIIFGRLAMSNDLVIESWISTDSAQNRSQGRLVAPNAIKNGEMQFFAATINPAGEMKLYIDGKLVASRPDGQAIKNVGRGRNFIGHSSYCYLDPDFKGLMDEFWLYNRVLTEEELKKLYNE